MALKLVVLTALFVTANAGLIATPVVSYETQPHATLVAKVAHPAVDAVASTHQNVVRSFDGTVSTYSKAIDAPYSSVRKEDTRISNNVYTPVLAKAVTYGTPHTDAVYQSMPVISKTVHAVSAPTVYTQQPAVPTAAAPIYVPTVHRSVNTPFYQHRQYEVPVGAAAATTTTTTTYNHGPAASTYTHSAPGIAAYGSSQTVHYSPAENVSHMSFDGFGTHWGF